MPPSRKSPDPSHAETRQRLLTAAGQVFAEHGFRATTIRDIVQRAQANIAAVNYHFRDKLGLYTAVLQQWAGQATAKYPPTLGLGPNPTPRQRLHAFIRSFLLRILDEGQPAWHGKLMAREIMEPTPALDDLIEQHMRPLNNYLHIVLRDLLGPAATPALLARCAASVVGQCLFYHHARAVVERLNPSQKFAAADLNQLADHITTFSIGGLKQQAADLRKANP